MTVKCPKCKWKGSNSQYMRHYSRTHYKGKKKSGKGKIKVTKIPVWARRRK